MAHPLEPSQFVKDRLQRIRGSLRLYGPLEVRRTALVIIDMQNAFVDPSGPIHVPAALGIVPVINALAAGCRSVGVPVIWIRSHHPKGGADWRGFFDHFVLPERRQAAAAALSDDAPSSRFYPEMDVRDEDFVVTKNRYSCFIAGSSSLERLLRSQGRDQVLLAGTKTNICVESTARDGMMIDFYMTVLSDATASLTDAEHQASLDVLVQEFADILTSEQALFELGADVAVPDAVGVSR